jgi:hypothetical protein
MPKTAGSRLSEADWTVKVIKSQTKAKEMRFKILNILPPCLDAQRPRQE